MLTLCSATGLMTSLVAVLTLICVSYVHFQVFHTKLRSPVFLQVFVMTDNYIFLAIDAVLYKGKLRTGRALRRSR